LTPNCRGAHTPETPQLSLALMGVLVPSASWPSAAADPGPCGRGAWVLPHALAAIGHRAHRGSLYVQTTDCGPLPDHPGHPGPGAAHTSEDWFSRARPSDVGIGPTTARRASWCPQSGRRTATLLPGRLIQGHCPIVRDAPHRVNPAQRIQRIGINRHTQPRPTRRPPRGRPQAVLRATRSAPHTSMTFPQYWP
jgi:hypothetical protein